MITRTIVDQRVATCPDCSGSLVLRDAETFANKFGEICRVFFCSCPDDEGLCDLDILLEWNETWTVDDDHALLVYTFEESDDEDDD